MKYQEPNLNVCNTYKPEKQKQLFAEREANGSAGLITSYSPKEPGDIYREKGHSLLKEDQGAKSRQRDKTQRKAPV